MMQRNIVLLMVTFICLSFSSCAYFNTFYNTKKLFREANKERERRQGAQPTTAEKKKYDDTIAKASKILEVYPNSKYVDDSLFILGVSFYYKQEYIKAQRKFQELSQYFPNSSYYPKARIWLAKTDIELTDFASAKLLLDELLQTNKLKSEIREEARYLQGDISFRQNSFQPAELEYKAAAHTSRDKSVKSRAYFKLGECQIVNGKPGEAAKSFKACIKNDTDKRMEFDALLSYAKALKLDGEFDSAIAVCNELLENETYKAKKGYAQLELADITYYKGKALNRDLAGTNLSLTGNVQEALEEYDLVVLENKRTEVAATAYYRMGEIYLNDLKNFSKAKENYDKVKIEYRKSEHVDEASRKAKDIGELIKLNNLVKKSQGGTLMQEANNEYGLSPLALLLLEHGNHPELRFMQERKKRAQLEKRLHVQNAEKPPVDEDEIARVQQINSLVGNKLQLAEAYMFKFGQIDSALAEYNDIMLHFKGNPGAAKATYSTALIYEKEYHNKAIRDSLLHALIAEYPNTEQAVAARKKLDIRVETVEDPARALYMEAERSLFVEQNIPLAIDSYQKIADNFPNSEYAPKALYAIGWIHESIIFDNARAAQYYGLVMNRYPDSEFTGQVTKKMAALGRAPKTKKQQPEVKPESNAPKPWGTPRNAVNRKAAENTPAPQSQKNREIEEDQ